MIEFIVNRLNSQYKSIEFLISGLEEENLKRRLQTDKWSIHENIAHLGRYQEVFYERVQRILNEDNPYFERYKAEDDPLTDKWFEKSTNNTIEDLQVFRKYLNTFLISLENHEIQKTGIHPKLGKMNIEQWTEFFLLHEAHHLYTILWLSTNV